MVPIAFFSSIPEPSEQPFPDLFGKTSPETEKFGAQSLLVPTSCGRRFKRRVWRRVTGANRLRSSVAHGGETAAASSCGRNRFFLTHHKILSRTCFAASRCETRGGGPPPPRGCHVLSRCSAVLGNPDRGRKSSETAIGFYTECGPKSEAGFQLKNVFFLGSRGTPFRSTFFGVRGGSPREPRGAAAGPRKPPGNAQKPVFSIEKSSTKGAEI